MPDSRTLVQAAVILREQAPQAWEHFTLAFSAYAAQVAIEMVRAEPDKLQRAQGMAMQAQELAVMFKDAMKLFEQFRAHEVREQSKRVNNDRQRSPNPTAY